MSLSRSFGKPSPKHLGWVGQSYVKFCGCLGKGSRSVSNSLINRIPPAKKKESHKGT